MSRRALLLLLALGLAGTAALHSFARVGRQLEIAATCDAAARQEWDEVLRLSEGLVSADADGRYGAECRCWALLATERGDECTALLESLLRTPAAADWIPDVALAKQLIRARRDRGELGAAADLARRASALHAQDLNLLHLDLALHSALEGEARVLRAAEASLGDDPASLRRRIVLAGAYRRRGDADAAVRVLGDVAPTETLLLTPWFDERTGALADLGRMEALRASFMDWEARGGSPVELRARFALRVSTSQLTGAGSVISMLQASLAERSGLADPELVQRLFERLIAHLVANARNAEAMAVYDVAIGEVELPALSREQLERSVDALAGHFESASATGGLLFRVPPEAVGGTLFVSPPAANPPDGEFEAYSLRSDEALRIERGPSVWPVRWGLRDASGVLRGSGSAWVSPGAVTPVAVSLRDVPEPRDSLPQHFGRAPGDGIARVFALVLDCADWRLVSYLRMRGELPFLDHQLRSGHRAVLDSSPPLTAAAMESLVWPERGEHVSFLGQIHQLGLEVAGLASVGRNPVGFLAGLLPETRSLFDVVGDGPKVAANMLFAHGAIAAGRHAELTGPHAKRRLARQAETFRVLRPEEQRRFPALVADPRVRSRVESIASEFDVAEVMAREAEVDLLLLRIESLDVLTHALYVELERAGQDDGQATLLEVYRYIDSRLAALDSLLDTDDVLIVMSDHGIRNAMEHDRHAIFAAAGGGVPVGRSEGTPALRGVPQVLARLLGVEMQWEDTGIAPWLGSDEHRLAVVGSRP